MRWVFELGVVVGDGVGPANTFHYDCEGEAYPDKVADFHKIIHSSCKVLLVVIYFEGIDSDSSNRDLGSRGPQPSSVSATPLKTSE